MTPGRPLKIAIIHASDRGGGAERSVISLHRGLRALGHESTVFVGERHTDEPGVVEIPYVRGVPGARRAARWLESSTGLQDIYNPSFRHLKKLTRHKFDVLHFNSLWGSAGFADIGALPALTDDAPGVVTMRENWLITGHCACFHDCQRWLSGCGSCPDLTLAPAIPHDATRLNWLRKRSVLARSNLHVVAISDWLRQKATQSPLLTGKPVTRIYNGVDLDIYKPADPIERARKRQSLGIADSDVVVLLAGQTVEGIRTGIAAPRAIEALNRLRAIPSLRALVVGHSAEAVANKLEARTICMPFQHAESEMASCYQVADVCLVTSEFEAFGRIAAESQACGTPVVAFAVGGIPEVVPHGRGGCVVLAGDIDALAQGLRSYVESAEFRRSESIKAMAHVRGNFDQATVAGTYAALYSRLVDDFKAAAH